MTDMQEFWPEDPDYGAETVLFFVIIGSLIVLTVIFLVLATIGR